ncbi:MAG: NAD(P)H-dependent glycerol-3-phosphate dehydrogenase [Spirochaetia bacterium]|nr:NAD(P)H-dependent glycerol-3-phosphate dehydrogenase [Spirochaetia bacterium]
MKVSVLGAGGWGTALAIILAERDFDTTMWEFFPDYAVVLDKQRENIKFLKGVKIPDTITITSDLKQAVEGAELLVLAVPSHILRGLLEKVKMLQYKGKTFVSVIKGIEQDTLKTPSHVIKDVLGNVKVAILSGPSHAEEVGRKIPTTVVLASKDRALAEKVRGMFFTSYFRTYSNTDVTGVELGGSVKNVIAIAAGVLDGLNMGDNTKAALITRGLAEMRRLGVRMGADPDTFSGLSGVGDLIVTCDSKHSRNRFVGEQLGSGKSIKDILAGMDMVAEGVKTTLSVYRLAQKYKVDMPITNEVYEVIYNNKSAHDSIRELMGRPAKSEREFLR